MRKTILMLTALTAILFTYIVSCNNPEPKKETATTEISNDSLIKRGDYLVSAIGGCDDCHSPKKMTAQGPEIDMDKRFSGYPADRPFGKVDSNIVAGNNILLKGICDGYLFEADLGIPGDVNFKRCYIIKE